MLRTSRKEMPIENKIAIHLKFASNYKGGTHDTLTTLHNHSKVANFKPANLSRTESSFPIIHQGRHEYFVVTGTCCDLCNGNIPMRA